jgi:uncharacterized membrane protein YedE/YeeE
LLENKLELPTLSKIDSKLILGAAVFGIGWGLGGLCPGPALTLMPIFSFKIGVSFLAFVMIGRFYGDKLDEVLF